MNKTDNYNMNLPESTDSYNVTHMNDNTTIIDAELKRLADKKGITVGTTAPSDTTSLWVDTGNGGITKYYNGTTWVATASTWG